MLPALVTSVSLWEIDIRFAAENVIVTDEGKKQNRDEKVTES